MLLDTQGPEIRTGDIANDLELKNGSVITISVRDSIDVEESSFHINYDDLMNTVDVGDRITVDNGIINLQVLKKNENSTMDCKVIDGGILKSKRHVNLPGIRVNLPAITKKDRADILFGMEQQVDFIALSFVREANDILELKELMGDKAGKIKIIAKIEDQSGVKNIDEIIAAADGIMVARGDLGVEIGDPQLPAQQKRLILLARANDRFVITATQMLESMITSPIPTRAEVFDVANAVLDGTDAVMLSAETAVGAHPEEAVKTMSDVCLETEKSPTAKVSHHRLHEHFEGIDETIAMSSMYAANHLGAKVVATLTQTGKTALWMSRISSNIAIFAMSDNYKTLKKVTIYRGVYPCYIDKTSADDWNDVNSHVIENLEDKSQVEKGDIVIVTKGMHKDKSGGTNLMKILRVGDGNY